MGCWDYKWEHATKTAALSEAIRMGKGWEVERSGPKKWLVQPPVCPVCLQHRIEPSIGECNNCWNDSLGR